MKQGTVYYHDIVAGILIKDDSGYILRIPKPALLYKKAKCRWPMKAKGQLTWL